MDFLCCVSCHGDVASVCALGCWEGGLCVTSGPAKCADCTDVDSGPTARAHPPPHSDWAVPGVLLWCALFVSGLGRIRSPVLGMPVMCSERKRGSHDGRFALVPAASDWGLLCLKWPQGLDLCCSRCQKTNQHPRFTPTRPPNHPPEPAWGPVPSEAPITTPTGPRTGWYFTSVFEFPGFIGSKERQKKPGPCHCGVVSAGD